MQDDECKQQALALAMGARTAHPGLSASAEEFAEHLVHLAQTRQWVLEDLRVEDLYLAWCCGQGCQRALDAFWNECVPSVRRAARSVTKDSDRAEDVVQDVLHKLLVASAEKPAALASYEGRSRLVRWLRSVAIRAALSAERSGHDDTREDEDAASELPFLSDDPELSLLKEQSGETVEHALREALKELDPENRLVLQQHMVDGLGIDQLATIYRIHRATAARRIARARDELLSSTRQRLRTSLQLTGPELDSLIDFAQSRVRFSLRWLEASAD